MSRCSARARALNFRNALNIWSYVPFSSETREIQVLPIAKWPISRACAQYFTRRETRFPDSDDRERYLESRGIAFHLILEIGQPVIIDARRNSIGFCDFLKSTICQNIHPFVHPSFFDRDSWFTRDCERRAEHSMVKRENLLDPRRACARACNRPTQ